MYYFIRYSYIKQGKISIKLQLNLSLVLLSLFFIFINVSIDAGGGRGRQRFNRRKIANLLYFGHFWHVVSVLTFYITLHSIKRLSSRRASTIILNIYLQSVESTEREIFIHQIFYIFSNPYSCLYMSSKEEFPFKGLLKLSIFIAIFIQLSKDVNNKLCFGIHLRSCCISF